MTEELVKFLYEIGQLKRVCRSGWWLAQVQNPETVAEHVQRTAIVGYFLAKLEHVDAYKVLLMCLFDDIHETRLNDLHKVGHRYIDFKAAEPQVHIEQFQILGELGKEILEFINEFHRRQTPEAQVARDADLLETALQAREYLKIGYTGAQNWINNIRTILHTTSAKEILNKIEQADPQEWWRELKKIER